MFKKNIDSTLSTSSTYSPYFRCKSVELHKSISFRIHWIELLTLLNQIVTNVQDGLALSYMIP